MAPAHQPLTPNRASGFRHNGKVTPQPWPVVSLCRALAPRAVALWIASRPADEAAAIEKRLIKSHVSACH
jgi:hypothetical protein